MDFQPTAQPLVAGGLGWVGRGEPGWIWGLAGRVGLRRGRCKYVPASSVAACSCALSCTHEQDRGWASCPTRPRHASGPCGSRPCATPPARPLTHSGGSARHGKKRRARAKAEAGAALRSAAGVRSLSRRKRDLTPTPLRSDRCVDQGRHLPEAARTHRHRETVEGGEVSDGGVSAAWMPRPSPQGRVYGVPAIRHLPASPRRNPEPLWLWLWLWPLRVQGGSPVEHPPLRSPGMARRYP